MSLTTSHRYSVSLLATLIVALTLPAAAQVPAPLPSALKPVKAPPPPPSGFSPKPSPAAPGKAPTPPPGPTGPTSAQPSAPPGQPGAPPSFAPGAPPGASPSASRITPPGFAPGAAPTAPSGQSPTAPPGYPPGFPPGYPPGAPPNLPPGFIPIPIPVPVPIDANHGPNISFEEAVAALKSGDHSFKNAYWPLRVLDKLPVDAKRREEVAALIDPLLLSDNTSLQHAAVDAIQGWGTKKNIPTLLKLLEYQNHSDRDRAMKALGAIGGSKEAAHAVAARLLVSADRYDAEKSLSKMGAYAEEVIWQYVGSADDQVHRAACGVLGDVGTTKSLLKLRGLRRDSSSYRQSALESAQKEMQKRLVKK